jgi:uncharacterized protein (DUF2141 family)
MMRSSRHYSRRPKSLLCAEPLERRSLCSYTPIDLAPYANDRMQNDGYSTAQYPSGAVTLAGVPFQIAATGNNCWRAGKVKGANPHTLTVTVGQAGVTGVRTLINTDWGTAKPGRSHIEFVGSAGADYVVQLVGGTDMRDFNRNVFTNRINGTTTVNAFTTKNGQNRLDMQIITLPAAFQSQKLDKIIFSDTSVTNVQSLRLQGLTLHSADVAPTVGGTVYGPGGTIGQAGVTVYIDANRNGLFDAGEVSVLTDAAGGYLFTGLAAGTYRIGEVPPAGYGVATPVGGFSDVVLAGATVSGVNFVNVPANASISGLVFNDANSNRRLDSTELGLGGWQVYLDLNNDKKYDAGDVLSVTDSEGKWSFTGLAAGSFVVRIVQPTKTATTTPAGGGQTVVVSTSLAVTGVRFGEKRIG